VSILLQVACSAPAERSDEPSPVDTALAQLGDAFVSRTANVNGTTGGRRSEIVRDNSTDHAFVRGLFESSQRCGCSETHAY
jgi:hypothetical protein